jgi:hypothetical protein
MFRTFLSLTYALSKYNWSRIAFVYTAQNDINQGFSTCKYFAESFDVSIFWGLWEKGFANNG